MHNSTAINYLYDLGRLIKEKALEAKANKVATNNPYDVGFLMALHEVVSLMQSQAIAFGIPVEEIGLSDIDPEIELL